jgi:hypothetical protein
MAEDCAAEISVPFSLFDEESRTFIMPSRERSIMLLDILRAHYPGIIVAIMPVYPFLVIECRGKVPDPATTPFLIAGLIACFVVEGMPYPFGIDFIGYSGKKEGPAPETIPPEILRDIKPFHIPSLTTFEFLYKYIGEAINISIFPQQLVVELELASEEDFDEKLLDLPDEVGCLQVGYVNGTFLSKKQSRKEESMPKIYDGDYDDTNYLVPENRGILRPGVLSESGGEDIGLMTCNAPYSNQFPDLPTSAKALLHPTQLKWGQYVMMDSCFTGIQRLRVLGVRTRVDRRSSAMGTSQAGPITHNHYIKIDQGIFGVKSSVIPTEPIVREGVCGTPLVIAGNSSREQSKSLSDGIVVGFMLCTDVQGLYNTDKHIYSFAQLADPLIEGGWTLRKD